MKLKTKIIVKIIISLICVAVFIYCIISQILIKNGAFMKPVEFGAYTLDAPEGAELEDSVIALLPIAYEGVSGSSIETAYFCLALFESRTVGFIQLPTLGYRNIYTNYSLNKTIIPGYENWCMSSSQFAEQITSLSTPEPLPVRGTVTTAPPELINGYKLLRYEMPFLTQFFPNPSSMPLLDTTKELPTQRPTIFIFPSWVMVLSIIVFLYFLITLKVDFQEKKLRSKGFRWLKDATPNMDAGIALIDPLPPAVWEKRKLAAIVYFIDGFRIAVSQDELLDREGLSIAHKQAVSEITGIPYTPPVRLTPEQQQVAAAKAAIAARWTCSCGRNHPANVSCCVCGVSKREMQKAAQSSSEKTEN